MRSFCSSAGSEITQRRPLFGEAGRALCDSKCTSRTRKSNITMKHTIQAR